MNGELKIPKAVEAAYDYCFAEEIVCQHCRHTITTCCADHGRVRGSNSWVASLIEAHMRCCYAKKPSENSANQR